MTALEVMIGVEGVRGDMGTAAGDRDRGGRGEVGAVVIGVKLPGRRAGIRLRADGGAMRSIEVARGGEERTSTSDLRRERADAGGWPDPDPDPGPGPDVDASVSLDGGGSGDEDGGTNVD